MPEAIRHIIKEFPWRHIALICSGIPIGATACYLAGRVVLYQVSVILLILMMGIVLAVDCVNNCHSTSANPRSDSNSTRLSQSPFNLVVGCFFGFGLAIVYVF